MKSETLFCLFRHNKVSQCRPFSSDPKTTECTFKKWTKVTKRNREESIEENVEDAGIDPATSRMLSERSTIWANPPCYNVRYDDTESSYAKLALYHFS